MNLLETPRLNVGWEELALSLGCTLLLAGEAFVGRSAILPQTAEAYFAELEPAKAFQIGALALDLAILLTTLALIVSPNTFRRARALLAPAAFVGVALSWSETLWASSLAGRKVFVLNELPYRPLANAGLGGALLFGGYLAFKLPTGRMPAAQSLLTRLALALCQASLQVLVWDSVSRRLSGGSL